MYYYIEYTKPNVNLDKYKYTPVDYYWQLYYGITFLLSLKMYILFCHAHIRFWTKRGNYWFYDDVLFYFLNLLGLYFTVNTSLSTIRRAKRNIMYCLYEYQSLSLDRKWFFGFLISSFYGKNVNGNQTFIKKYRNHSFF